MPVLDNPRKEKFVQALLKGKTQNEAYASAGYKPSEQNASRLMRNDKVQARLRELQERIADKTVTAAERMIAQLAEDRALARELKQAAAATSASMGMAKIQGLLVDKLEVKNVYSDMTDRELDDEIANMMVELKLSAWDSTLGQL